jgi:hypothetical protein
MTGMETSRITHTVVALSAAEGRAIGESAEEDPSVLVGEALQHAETWIVADYLAALLKQADGPANPAIQGAARRALKFDAATDIAIRNQNSETLQRVVLAKRHY